jgi:hypothetical protein
MNTLNSLSKKSGAKHYQHDAVTPGVFNSEQLAESMI